MPDETPHRYVARAATVNPPNRFEHSRQEADHEHGFAEDEQLPGERRKVETEFLPDRAETLIRENDSPDVSFRFSLNAYRGCEHGCVYCYARPGHETLGMNAGLDFETRVLVKFDAARILRRELNKKKWQPEPIMISGVTDCYQPAERRFRLTRGILEVLLEAEHPLTMITKNSLILRDLDLLRPLAERKLVGVGISITTLDADLARTMEPRTATPAAKLRAIRELTSAGVSVRVMVAPIIPGLNDHEVPAILAAAKAAGAHNAGYVMLRLPWAVAPIFSAWLLEHRPLQADKVESLLREVRGGKLYDAEFGQRMTGTGPYADSVRTTFQAFCRKLGLDQPSPALDCSRFRPPRLPGGQGQLF
ncbi:Radical SAM superfamily protein [Anatilimnocola aggregata]|uniref:Radical SAM superfamily protein n=1 Tax=Anatilimnocola aggregata TaxID=2528021 RepID=A0A517Y4L8_9BACT|nr:PA0069 family radical SAM protein [Anatilimnocola aggregata]QDU25193.1 Radical SAM superfamily protein [Anatilimnocola aggregata]